MLRCLQRHDAMTSPLATRRTMQPTRQRRWTYADYCRIPADGKRHEIVDGRHFVNPAPSPRHQIVSGDLYTLLRASIQDPGRGRVLYAPLDVHLGRGSIVQPDLVAVRRQNLTILGDKKVTGAPDLLVEVLSPSNRAYDRSTKRARYERAGVREFWLVDPESHTVEQLVLRKGRYQPPIVCTSSITLRAFRGITIALTDVW